MLYKTSANYESTCWEQPCQTCSARGFMEGRFAAASGYPHLVGRWLVPKGRSIDRVRAADQAGRLANAAAEGFPIRTCAGQEP
jgi:hypothetical protein